MSPTPLFIVLATVLVVGEDGGRIDRGWRDGLREGDRGRLAYQLEVMGEKRRIAAGEAVVTEIAEHQARIAPRSGSALRTGYQVEFELAPERLAAGAVVEAARAARGEEAARQAASTLVDELVAQDDALAAAVAGRCVRALATAAAQVAGGSYRVGSATERAGFYNETPRFEARIDAFEIDRWPTAPAAGMTQAEAEQACRDRGWRLPSELEWEVAVGGARILVGSPSLEWTSSWYQPYPGNRHPEPEYGERFRVVRGAVAEEGQSFRRRLFLDPEQRNPRIGYRCARTVTR